MRPLQSNLIVLLSESLPVNSQISRLFSRVFHCGHATKRHDLKLACKISGLSLQRPVTRCPEHYTATDYRSGRNASDLHEAAHYTTGEAHS